MTKKPEPLDPEEFKRIAAELEALDILFSPPSQPMPVARKLMKGRDFAGLLTLLHWRNGWMCAGKARTGPRSRSERCDPRSTSGLRRPST